MRNANGNSNGYFLYHNLITYHDDQNLNIYLPGILAFQWKEGSHFDLKIFFMIILMCDQSYHMVQIKKGQVFQTITYK